MSLDLWPRASEFGGPVKLIGCDPNMKAAAGTGPGNEARAIEGGYDHSFVAGTGHLLQVEKPQECARFTLEFLARKVDLRCMRKWVFVHHSKLP
jgi:hypothetical protein